MKTLENHEWPGNIRQLRNCLRTLLALCEDNTIDMKDLDAELRLGSNPAQLPSCNVEDGTLQQDNPLACAERDAIVRELEGMRWNVTKVAGRLELSRNTLYRKMRRYGIKPPR